MPLTPEHLSEISRAVAREGKAQFVLAPADSSVGDCPPEWRGLLGSGDARRQVFDSLWSPMSAKLPRTIKAWKNCIQGIGLLTTAKRPPSLVYCYLRAGELYAFRGYAPTPVARPEAPRLPREFLEFFAIHNGFVDLFSASAGPSPDRDWSYLSDNPDEPAGKFLNVFSCSGGSCFGFDLDEALPLAYVVWPDDPPTLVTDIWATLDELMSSGLEGADLAR